MADLRLPRGVRDLMPNEALFRDAVLKKIERVFQSFGFLTIDTPCIENLDVLKAKGGIGEDAKLIYEMKDEKIGLRYDNTVSLARYMNMHQHLPLPFKRYYIGKVWRREEPQKLRYREIMMADADIIGGDANMADAEIIALGSVIFDMLELNYIVYVNDRTLLEKTLIKLGARADQIPDILRALDKLEKIGEDKVSQILEGLQLSKDLTAKLLEFTKISGSNEKKLDKLDKMLGEKESTTSLRKRLDLLEQYKIKGKVIFNTAITRGLDYYTGIVFEYKSIDDKDGPSLCGGGRYDNLTAMLGGRKLPAVGFAIGIDRLLDHMKFSSSPDYTYTKVFVAYVSESNYIYALKVADALRSAGILTEINISNRNLSNQFSYASSIKVNYVIIIGDAEEKEKRVKLRNLKEGKEKTLSISELLEYLKDDLNGKK